MSFNLNDSIAILGTILAILTTLTSGIFWYVNSEKKRYGLERDFAHMRRNYEQISQHLGVILTELDRRCDVIDKTLIEIKSNLKNENH